MRRNALLAVSLAFAPFALAQDPAPAPKTAAATVASASTDAPILSLIVLGPAGWRQRFAPTNVGSLLESEQGRALWQPQVAMLDGMAKAMLGGDDATFAAGRARLLDYGGAVQLALWVPRDEQGMPQQPEGGLVFGPDGKTDLTALAADLHRLLPGIASAAWTKQKVGDAELEVLGDGSQRVTAPIRDGERLLLAFGGDALAQTLQRVRALAPAAVPRPDAPALRLRFDVAALLASMPQDEESMVFRVAGLDRVRAIELALGTAGPQIAIDASIGFVDGERGLFGCLFPNAAAMTSMLPLLPKGAKAWKIGHLDLQQGYLAVERVVAEFEGVSGAGNGKPATAEQRQAAIDEVRKKVVAELGVDPVTGLLAHLGTDAMLLGEVGAVAPVEFTGLDDDAESKGGFLLALRLRDEQKFQQGFDAAIKHAKAFVNKAETTDHDGVAIHRYGGLFTGNVHVAIGRGLFVLAKGIDSEGRVGAVLDAQKAAAAAAPAPFTFASLPDFQGLERHAPAGLNGAGNAEVVSVLGALATSLEGITYLLPQRPEFLDHLDADARASLQAILQKHHLDRMRTLTGSTATEWRWRIFW